MSNDHDEGPEGVQDDAAPEVDADLSADDSADQAAEADQADADQTDAERAEDQDDVASAADDADAADEGALVGAGVAAAGSARAAARRSAVVKAGVSEKKGRATARRSDAEAAKGNIFSRFGRWVREIVDELRKVIWPGRKQMITYTIVVIVFVVVMVALIGGLDWAFAKGVLAVFG